MIVKGASLEQLLKRPASTIRAVLFYGPNEGRVREYAKRISQAIVPDIHDPFRIATLNGAALKDDPALLADEAAAIAMTGGRRVIRLSGAGEAQLPAFLNFLQDPKGDSLIVVEAGGLTKTSKLRKCFEDSPICAIAACYEDSATDLSAMVSDHLAQHRLKITSEAKDYLLQCLGEDRMASRQELDKLVIYKGYWPRQRDSTDSKDILACTGSHDIADIRGIRDGYDTIDGQEGAACQDIVGSGGIADVEAINDTAGNSGSHGFTAIHDRLDGYGGRDSGAIRTGADGGAGMDSHGGHDIGDIGDSHGGMDTYDTSDSVARPDSLVQLHDVMACIGDGGVHSLDEICDSLCLGDPVALDAHIQRAYAGGVSTITLLRAVSTHLIKLQLVIAAQAKGNSVDMALRVLRPPLPFTRIPAFRRMLALWNSRLAERALDQLLRAEAACKTTGAPDLSLCSQTLLQLAHLPRRARTF